MKGSICTVIGAIGGGIAALFGGWDSALVTLIIFMGIDFATGMITGAMGKSKHSKTGKLNSKAGWYGLAKKGSILMLIIVAVRLDILLNTNYVRVVGIVVGLNHPYHPSCRSASAAPQWHFSVRADTEFL